MSDNQTVVLDADLEDIFKKIDALSLGKAAQLVKAMEERARVRGLQVVDPSRTKKGQP